MFIENRNEIMTHLEFEIRTARQMNEYVITSSSAKKQMPQTSQVALYPHSGK